MPLFLIEYFTERNTKKVEIAEAIEGANSLPELVQKLDRAAEKYHKARIFILREDHYIRILTADLREWRELRDEERQQKDNDSLHK